jgi:hypothetical protein
LIVFRFLLGIFAFALIFLGVIAMVAPTPFGFVFVLLGFLILATVAPGFIRWMRKRWRWLDRRLDKLEEHAPRWLRKILKRSNPPDDEDTENGKDS